MKTIAGKVVFVLAASILTSSIVLGEAPSPTSSSSNSQQYPAYSYPSSEHVGPASSYSAPASSYTPVAPAPASSYGSPAQSSYGAPVYDNSQPYRGYGLDSESPFVQQRLFNTAVALTVPLFSFVLPQRSSAYGGIDLANQAIFGLFALFVVVLVFAVPILFTKPPGETGRSSDRDGILNNLMANNKVFNFMGADLSNKVGLDTTKCLQKTICEANRTPKKYGLLATPFQMFFPPPSNGTSEARASIFQLAAKDGKYSKKDCGKSFKCFFDFMDLGAYFVDWWKYSSDPNYVMQF